MPEEVKMESWWMRIFILLFAILSSCFITMECRKSNDKTSDAFKVNDYGIITDVIGNNNFCPYFHLNFKDNGDGTITDVNTELMWQNGSGGKMDWDNAMKYCDNLVLNEYSDWHLPTIDELRTLIVGCPTTMAGGECKISEACSTYECISDACDGCLFIYYSCYFDSLFNGECKRYWSSSSYALNAFWSKWYVEFYSGRIYFETKDIGGIEVRCVRSGHKTITGTVFNAKDNGDGTITDTSTGLIWQKGTGGAMNWDNAMKYCDDFVLNEYSDWHLPTIDELRTLIVCCPYTMSGGGCKITNEWECTSYDDYYCYECQGKYEDYGCFLSSLFDGQCKIYWSSSLCSSFIGEDDVVKYVFFKYGAISFTTVDSTEPYVRCVHSGK